MSLIKQLCLILALASFSSLAGAQTMFKCVQAGGKTSYQAEPCPDSTKEQVIKSDNRGGVQVVKPHVEKPVDPDAPLPTGARTNIPEKTDVKAESDRIEEAKPEVVADAAPSVPAPAPKKSLPVLAIVTLFLLGVAGIFGSIWSIVVAFRVSTMWGVLCLLIPFAHLVFMFVHWDRARRPFMFSLGTIAAAVVWGMTFSTSLNT